MTNAFEEFWRPTGRCGENNNKNCPTPNRLSSTNVVKTNGLAALKQVLRCRHRGLMWSGHNVRDRTPQRQTLHFKNKNSPPPALLAQESNLRFACLQHLLSHYELEHLETGSRR